MVDWLWVDLIETHAVNKEQQLIAEEIIDLGFKMFKKPTELFYRSYLTGEYEEESRLYVNALNVLWKERDIAKIYGGIGEARADRFKSEVLDKL
ncbi:MAG: hypothetical protein Q8T08_21570 [Ignavibacteria bacterium]|nr:hypothetical protein [Ignavibacteria bacterium]